MASSAAAIASVAPHVTVTWVSGSTLMPYHSPYFATRASRSRFAPQVMAYWFTSSWIARAAASFSTSGAAKLGNPWARLMAACSFASRVMPRITCWAPGTFARLSPAPPLPAGQYAAPAGFPRAARPLAAKTRGARAVLPALVRPFGRGSGPAFTPNELLVRFRPSAVGAPPVGSLALASRAVAAAVGAAMRSRPAGEVAQG